MNSNQLNRPKPVRRKVFVSYHHGNDQDYYDTLSENMDDRLELFTDNSLEREVDSADHSYIMRRIRENHLHGSSCTLVLCGADTWQRKYVDWEIEASLVQEMGLVGIWLPSLPLELNGGTAKPARLQDNIDSGYAVWVNWHDIEQDPSALRDAIERANNAPQKLIDNSRKRQGRNL
ncbi:TIR domain-containing protein [Kushneria indalinina]|uniref:TIR-like protein DUF1863 n=1 Tax=Kushneria indalinina DSM 14324 TaxID=1122140 RepID=A0A3D9DRK9_9GAMM|nr:TIR domain-containing protein [Kushneria indalinina]REC93388.1 TIR-like protein DUF1863 [Kushneria indalinina DSM 14324]